MLFTRGWLRNYERGLSPFVLDLLHILIATHPKANRGIAKIQLTYVTGRGNHLLTH